MRVLIASDKFKGSLSAAEVCAAVARGIQRSVPTAAIDCCPVADGGEGTVDAAVSAGFDRVLIPVIGPAGATVTAELAERNDQAVVELATASGLQLVSPGNRVPLTSSSEGTGQLMAAALDRGARSIVLGVGGSASTDGGAGLMTGLGAVLRDSSGRQLEPGGAALGNLDRLDLRGLHPRIADAEIVVACDVTNPLLGPNGAAAVYGPQKGASAHDVAALEAGLTRWADVVAQTLGRDDRDRPGAGAAGGVGFAALSLLGARPRSGIDVVLEFIRFQDRLAHCELVITGEGSLDQQSLAGKAPMGVASAAQRLGIPVIAVAGRTSLSPAELRAAGFRGAFPLTALEPDPQRCMRDAAGLLERCAALHATRWLAGEL